MGLAIGGIVNRVVQGVEAPLRRSGGSDLVDDLKEAKDDFISAVAPAIGVIELTGIRYPVKQYEAKVSDGLYRGSRLDGSISNYVNLKQQGVKAIVDLTAEGTEDEQVAQAQGFNLLNLKILDNTPPTTDQMKQFLDFVTKPENQPAYVHCEAGVGRTSVAVACYRMAVEGWTADQALADASKYGLKLESQINFIRDFGAQLQAGKIAGYPLPQEG
jgi:hypothetical protein